MPKQPETPQDWDPNTELPVPEDGGPDVGPGNTIDPLFNEPIQQFTVDSYGNTLPETESTQGLGGQPFEDYNMQNPAPGWTPQDGDLNSDVQTPVADYTMTDGGNVADFGNYSVDFGGGDQSTEDGYLARDALPPDAEQTAMSLDDLPRTDPAETWNSISQTHADQGYVPDISPDEAIDINTLGPFPGAPRTMGPPSGYDDLARDALPPDAEQTAMSLNEVGQQDDLGRDALPADAEQTAMSLDEAQASTVAADEAQGMSETEATQDTQLGMTTAQATTEAADEARGMSASEAIQDTQLGMTTDQAATEAADEAQGMSSAEAIQDTQMGLTADQAATEAAAEAQGVSADEAIQDAQQGLTADQTVTEAAAEAEGISPSDAMAEATGGETPVDPGDESDSPIPGLVDPNDPNWQPVEGGVGDGSPGEYPGLDIVDQSGDGGGSTDAGDGGDDGGGGAAYGDGGDGGDSGGDYGGGDGGDAGDSGGDYGGDGGDAGDSGGDYGGDGGDYGGDGGDGGDE